MKRIGTKVGLMVLVLAAIAAVAASIGHSTEAVACNGVKPANPASVSNTYNNTIPAANPISKAYGQSKPGSCAYDGAGYFNLNLHKCPSNWDNNAGITSSSINLFTSMPHSGPLAAYGGIGDGMESYFKYVNAHGGIAGRKINFTIDDDQLNPSITRSNVQSAIQSNKFAASFAILGTSNNLAVWDLMNQQCMPELMTASSDDRFADVDTHPWTTLFGLDLYTETGLWASYLEKKFPKGAKVVMITVNNGMGQVLTDGFTRAAKGTNLQIVGNELHSPSAATISDQVTSAAATGANVVLINDAGAFCIQALAGIERSSWKPLVIAQNACAQISTVFQPLQQQGATGNGTRVIRYYYAPTDADNPNKAFTAVYTNTLKSQGLDPTNAQYGNGWFWGWYVVQVLKDASLMKGGLNRANITLAAHQYKSTWPLMVKGAGAVTRGKIDAFPFEAGQMFIYTGATSSKIGHFVPDGVLINNNGKLKNWGAISTGG